MREHYPDADIEQEYKTEKAKQRAYKRELKKIKGASSSVRLEETLKPTAAVESLKQPCQPVEQNGMTVYAPIIEF